MKQYSFFNTDLLIDGLRVEGFQNTNAIISCNRNAPQHMAIQDAYGKTAVGTTADLSGTISFPLLQVADWNEWLYQRAQGTQATGMSGNKSLFVPLQLVLVDKMGDVQVNGINGVILKQPAIVRGTGFNINVWSIHVERLMINTGSYPETGV